VRRERGPESTGTRVKPKPAFGPFGLAGLSRSLLELQLRQLRQSLVRVGLGLPLAPLAAHEDRLPLDVELQGRPHRAEPLVVVARKGHPRVEGAIDLDTYLALDHIVATARPYGPGIEDMALDRMGLARRVAVRCQHAITAWQIVAASDMLFALPKSHAAVLDAMWPMQLVDLPLPVEPGGSYLYWHQAAQADPGLGWLRGIIVEELGKPA